MQQDVTFCESLKKNNIQSELLDVLQPIKKAVKRISEAIKVSDTGKAGSKNVYGEDQLALDVLSDIILQEEIKTCDLIGLIASEELDDEINLGEGQYAVCYDPLDGSSLVDVNLSVGTIFGIYKTNTFVGVKGEEMLAAGFAVYGPRTTLILATKNCVNEYTLSDDKFILTKHDLKVGEGKMFAPGNLRAVSSRDDYLGLMMYWMKEGYTLRYSGGMVPDINQILLKGKGIFTYPGYDAQPNGKLRLLFECAPMSFIMEAAGGAGTDGSVRILEKVVESVQQRSPIFVGSKREVRRAEEMMGK